MTAEILDPCCGGRHWWFDKDHPLAMYMDVREAPPGSIEQQPNWSCEPDVVGDFRAMEFSDGVFPLVVFDPPHISQPSTTGVIKMKYGNLSPETEQEDLRRGLAECWRVLAPGGTLVVKWSGNLDRIRPHFPAEPIVGTRAARNNPTRWFIFYKPTGLFYRSLAE